VVGPPSIHPSGRPYAWSVDSAPEFADAPVWLVAKIMAPVVQLDERRPPEHRTQQAHDGAAEGARNMTLASMAGRYFGWAYIRPRSTSCCSAGTLHATVRLCPMRK
jgi:hypothetical protein